jgi:predicted PurR-regulated permease PerM
MQQMDDFPFKDQGRFWLLFLILSFGLLWLLSAVLAPFITGLALAYLLDPLVRKISSLRTPRSLASVIVLLLFFILFIGLIVFISPIIARQAVEFFNNIPTYVEHFRSAITPYFQKLLGSLSPEDVQKIQDAASGHIGSVLNGAQKIFLRVWSGGMAVIDVVTFVVITPIVAFYCMRDWEVIVERIHALFPRQSAQTMKKLLADFDSRLSGFLRGQLLVCLCLGAFYG